MAEAAEVDTAQALVNHYEKTATFAASSDIARSSTVGSMRVDVKQKNRGKISIAWRTFQRYAWDDPDKPKEEKLFLFKLDCFLLSATCLGYFCKNLAQVCVAVASS
jgi:ACS family pantothenate transporter-like MFS transporter